MFSGGGTGVLINNIEMKGDIKDVFLKVTRLADLEWDKLFLGS